MKLKKIAHARIVAGNDSGPPRASRIAYFAQDLIGDTLVWANQLEALASRFAPCEVVVFCNAALAEMFECMAACDRVVAYDPAVPWGAEEARRFGRFDLVANTRYDADSVGRLWALAHERAIGFENIDIPEPVCREIYDAYVPLSRWDDYRLRRETSVTEQGAELVRLLDKGYHCGRVSFGKTDFVREAPDGQGEARIVFVVGASDPAKSWGLENYLELARRLRARGFRPMFLLGPKESGLAETIAHGGLEKISHGGTGTQGAVLNHESHGTHEKPCTFSTFCTAKTLRASASPRGENQGFDVGVCLPFREIAGLFDPDYGTRCVVGNDTGLMHLACAIGAPSVTVMPMGTHFTWFPYAGDNRAIHLCCSPQCARPLCTAECKEVAECAGKIAVEEVAAAICRIVNGGQPDFCQP